MTLLTDQDRARLLKNGELRRQFEEDDPGAWVKSRICCKMNSPGISGDSIT